MNIHNPARRRTGTGGRRRATACLCAAAATVLALTGCGRDHSPAPNTLPAPVASAAPLAPPLAPGPAYRAVVQERVGRRLNLSPQQARASLAADPDATLMTLSKPLGTAQDALAATIVSALNEAADSAVRSGRWTPRQAAEEKRFWAAQPQPALISEVSRWFREG